MIENFKINSKEIDKIKKIGKVERDFRINNLNLFNAKGFPNKKQEDTRMQAINLGIFRSILYFLILLLFPIFSRFFYFYNGDR